MHHEKFWPLALERNCLRCISISAICLLMQNNFRVLYCSKCIVLRNRWSGSLEVKVKLASCISESARKTWGDSTDYGYLNVVRCTENRGCEVDAKQNPSTLGSILKFVISYREHVLRIRIVRDGGIFVDGHANTGENAKYEQNIKEQKPLVTFSFPISPSIAQLSSTLCYSLALKYSPNTALTASGMDSSFRAFRSCSRP